MRREIGSEFWDVPQTNTANSLFPESTQWYLSGRSALQAIIKDLGEVNSVSLPSWCCESIIKPFADAGFNVHFYPVTLQEGLFQNIELNCDVLFIMDYFGYTTSVPDYKGFNGIIIRDVTHSLFSARYSDADYYFGSLRKWCGICTGGYAWTNKGNRLEPGKPDKGGYVDLRHNAMQMKKKYLEDRKGDKDYLRVFDMAEEYLETAGIVSATDQDVRLAQYLDADIIKKRRKANAEILCSAFPDWLVFPKLISTDCPMFVPVIVPDGRRDGLRRFLIEQSIYCPVHWPVSKYHKLDKKTEYIYENELSLVCDQRYSENDMYRIVDSIKAFMGE